MTHLQEAKTDWLKVRTFLPVPDQRKKESKETLLVKPLTIYATRGKGIGKTVTSKWGTGGDAAATHSIPALPHLGTCHYFTGNVNARRHKRKSGFSEAT